ncbi:hypothetical protein RCC89_00625 [Cytophagaceae bacterium ABcell3]|nr:hypothetical protein RCC89_00625 [Cytophagaceae bacterium ABcell3]
MKRTLTSTFGILTLIFVIVFASSCKRQTMLANKALQEKTNNSMSKASAAAPSKESDINLSQVEEVEFDNAHIEYEEPTFEEKYVEKEVAEAPQITKSDVKKIAKENNLNFAERLALKHAVKKINKIQSAEATGKSNIVINELMRVGLILLAVGLLIMLILGMLGSGFWMIGNLVAVIGLIIALVGLLQQLL